MTKESRREIADHEDAIYYDKTGISDFSVATGSFTLRGIPIETLANHYEYEDVAALLIDRSIPGDATSQLFKEKLTTYREPPPLLIDLLRHMTTTTTDVALRTVIPSLSNIIEPKPPHAWSLIALAPTIIVIHAALRAGLEPCKPNHDLNHVTDFMTRLLRRPVTRLESRIINLDFVLRAEQGANSSSFVARIAASTESDVFSAISAAIATFAGHRHGGAEVNARNILDELGSAKEARKIANAIRSEEIAVFGFRKSELTREDPRTRLLYQAALDLSTAHGDRQLFDLFQAIVDDLAPAGYFPDPNHYASIIYRLLGVPEQLWLSIFAAARVTGWLAHIHEQRANNILIRPRLTFVGRDQSDC